jgi:hypothetical protein
VNDLNSEKDYAPTSLYARTKLLNILMTRCEKKYNLKCVDLYGIINNHIFIKVMSYQKLSKGAVS